MRTIRPSSLRGSSSLTVGALVVLALLGDAASARASWTAANCSGGSMELGSWKRSQAQDYAQMADREGYEWGGGCFKLNDRDDTPGMPDSGGEGTDCSGLVFKSWALHQDASAGYRYWDHDKAIHGPFSTASYYAPASSYPFKPIAKGYAATEYMDAFVYRTASNTAGHIGMIYAEGSGGTDLVIESKGDAYGTGIFWETYRSQTAYRGVRRKAWTPECYPRCASPSR
jgi:hypothetical protein